MEFFFFVIPPSMSLLPSSQVFFPPPFPTLSPVSPRSCFRSVYRVPILRVGAFSRSSLFFRPDPSDPSPPSVVHVLPSLYFARGGASARRLCRRGGRVSCTLPSLIHSSVSLLAIFVLPGSVTPPLSSERQLWSMVVLGGLWVGGGCGFGESAGR